MSAVNAWKRVKRAARLAGITEVPVSPHFLRLSHGTHVLRRGADLATVRDTLGHESIATTSRYLHALALPPGAVTYGQIARTNQISVERVRQLEQRAFDAVAGAATTPGTPSAQFAALLRATIAPERPNALDRIDRIATALFPTGWRAAFGATVARLASLTDLVLGLRRNRHWPACNDRG